VDDWNRGDLDALDEHLDPEYVHRDPNNPDVTDRTSYKRWAAAARAAFPDLTVTIDDLIAEDDRVAKLWSFAATHKGEYMGITRPADVSPGAELRSIGCARARSFNASGALMRLVSCSNSE
jgi:hypothetical protein